MAKRGNRRHSYNGGNQAEVLRAELAYKQKVEANRNARRVARSQGAAPVAQPEAKQPSPVTKPETKTPVVENNNTIPQPNAPKVEEQHVEKPKGKEEIAVGKDARLEQLKKELAFGLHTPEERQAIMDEIEALSANKTAELETNTDTSKDKEDDKWKGEEFKEGKIIDYLYGKFLNFCSWGTDKIGNFLISASVMGGEFLGQGMKNTFQGGKELVKDYKEKANIRDFRNSAQYIDALYDREVQFYKNQRDYAIGTLKEAKAYALLLQNGTSAAAIEATYKKYGQKNKLLAKAYAALTQQPKCDEDTPNRFYTEEQRNSIIKTNIAALKGRFGPQIFDAIVPHTDETPAAFKDRSLGTLNSAIDHSSALYEVQTGLANAVKAQTLAEYTARYNGNENLSAEEKEKAVRTLYHNNAKELNDAVTQRCGNIIKDGITAQDLKAVNGFIDNRIQSSVEILQDMGKTLDSSKAIGDKPREEFKARCEAVHSIKLETPSHETEPQGHTTPKEKRMDPLTFAKETNKVSPVEEKYEKLEAKEAENAAKKAKKEERREAFKQTIEGMYKDTDWYKRHQERKQKREERKNMGVGERTVSDYTNRSKHR